MRVAVDAMGGDYAPAAVVEGAVLAARSFPELQITLVGRAPDIEAQLKRLSASDCSVDIHHATQVIGMDEPSRSALRDKTDSSITQAIRLAKEGKVNAVMSAGNTAAMVAAATVLLGRLPGIRRPGLAACFPTRAGKPCLVIDVGANIGTEPSDLLDYAEMASIFLQVVRGVEKPAIGLMNIGEEAVKGNKLAKETQRLMEAAALNYRGNAEGSDVFRGELDIIVCDGFVGNVMLKGAEGLADFIKETLRSALTRTWWLKLGAALCKPGFRELHARLDTAEYGGAPLLGVDGNVVKTHGSSGPRAICLGIKRAFDLARERVNERIVAQVAELAALKAGGQDA